MNAHGQQKRAGMLVGNAKDDAKKPKRNGGVEVGMGKGKDTGAEENGQPRWMYISLKK